MKYGTIIRVIRALRGQRAKDMAVVLGVTASHMSLLEANKRVPGPALWGRFLATVTARERKDLAGLAQWLDATDKLRVEVVDA